MTFRGYDDYISKYRRVLDYFDAYKIGLTATPALHTSQIFGVPIYAYSYREAVMDGYLVDYEPSIQIHTELSTNGIAWKVGEELKVYDPRRNQIDLFKAPDEIKVDNSSSPSISVIIPGLKPSVGSCGWICYVLAATMR